ncbi:UNVERIFIED_CONTAM: hypothetical protein Sradi_2990900 [Sesamum radiatum]|uniref:Uncharacterized protein n=1 Tax=Sesamum radiatum TaxID=300843 RepID=A0AAW2S2J6_SESRA
MFDKYLRNEHTAALTLRPPVLLEAPLPPATREVSEQALLCLGLPRRGSSPALPPDAASLPVRFPSSPTKRPSCGIV